MPNVVKHLIAKLHAGNGSFAIAQDDKEVFYLQHPAVNRDHLAGDIGGHV
jgi:hypothetical protein